MKGWQTIKIANLCDVENTFVQTGPFGSQLHESDYSIDGIPVIMPKDISNGKIITTSIARVSENHVQRLKRHKVLPGDIVYGRRGDIGRHALITELESGWLCGTGCLLIRLNKLKVNSIYNHYYLSQQPIIDYVANQAIGATMPNLNTEILKNIPLYLPTLSIQNKIAAVLTAYDDLIENNNRRIAILEKMAEELYREWFVRLRFPGHEKGRIVKGVPVGWRVKKLPEIADITYGYPFEGSRFNILGIGKPIIRIRNIPDSSTTDYTDEEAKEKHIVRKGDLLVGMDGDFHINHWYGEEAYLVQRSCRIKSRDPLLHGYLSKAIVAPVTFYESILQGATVGHLGAKHLNSIDILIPASEFKNNLIILNDLVDQKVKYSSSNNNLKISRDRLLTRLMSGKIDVENLDIQFPASMKEDKDGRVL